MSLSGCACLTPRRRQVLAGMAALTGLAALSAPARAASPLGPDGALEELARGNARFVADTLHSLDEDLGELRRKNLTGQAPFAAVLSCADSRVPVELLFDQSIGRLFVTRVAGNVCTPEIIASLEYAAAVLGISAIMVLGHGGCGAVKATIAGKPAPGQISALYAPIQQAVSRAGPDLDATIKENARIQADILRTASPVLADLIRQGTLKVVAGHYDLASGGVSVLA